MDNVVLLSGNSNIKLASNLLDGIYFIDSLCKIFDDSFDTNFNVKLAIDELVLNYFVTNRS